MELTKPAQAIEPHSSSALFGGLDASITEDMRTGPAKQEARNVRKHASVVVHGLVGWAICGATIGVGRQLASVEITLLIHVVAALLAFGLLTWHHFRRFPESSAASTSLTMVGIVVGLDALLVAPFLESSYAMFKSVIGTWLPFASIAAASYFVGRVAGSIHGTPGSGEVHAAKQAAAPDGRPGSVRGRG